MFFVLLVSILSRQTSTFLILVGSVDGRYQWAGMNLSGISQCIISYEASKDLIFVQTVQLKSMIKDIRREEWSLVA